MNLFVNLKEGSKVVPVRYDYDNHRIIISIHEDKGIFTIIINDIPQDLNPWSNQIFEDMYIRDMDDNLITFAKIPEQLNRIIRPVPYKILTILLPTTEQDQLVIRNNIMDTTNVIYTLRHRISKKKRPCVAFIIEMDPGNIRMCSFGFTKAKCPNYSAEKIEKQYAVVRIDTSKPPYYKWEYTGDDYFQPYGTYTNIKYIG